MEQHFYIVSLSGFQQCMEQLLAKRFSVAPHCELFNKDKIPQNSKLSLKHAYNQHDNKKTQSTEYK